MFKYWPIVRIYKNELDKACFQHDMTYNKFKDLQNRTQSGFVLKNKAFKIATIQNMMVFKELWPVWWEHFLMKDKKKC